MDNFTPLKVEKKKRKINKFLIFGNLFLVVLVAAIGIFYYNNILISKQQKAITPGDKCCFQGGEDTTSPCSEAKPGHFTTCPDNWTCEKQNNGFGDCVPPDGGGGGGGQKCPNDQPLICDTSKIECVNPAVCVFPNKPVVPLESCGGNQYKCYTSCSCNPSPTPTPPTATNTPTPTQPIMSVCNETCSNSNPCFNEEPGPNELVCTNLGNASRCRNKACTTSSTCVCPTSTPTPTRTPTPTPTGTIVPSNTPTPTPTGTIVPSNTPTVTPTNTPGPSATPIPVICGTKDCDDVTNPCRSGYDCVQANNGSNYCTSPDFTDACIDNPSYNSCCTAPGAPTATPTEIILAQTTVTSPPVPVTGMVQSFMYLIPALIMLVGLIL